MTSSPPSLASSESSAPAQCPHPVAIVTGAGSGIGLATAHRLRALGYGLVLAGRRREPLDAAVAQLAPLGPGDAPVVASTCDISREADVQKLIGVARERFGRLDVLVNNAGYAPLVPIGRTTPDIIRQAFAINAYGPALAIHFAWPMFEAQRRGCVVNISTKGTYDPFPGFFAYAAAKAGVNLMAKSVGKEGARLNVRGFAVAPGAVETAMLRGSFSEKAVPPKMCLAPDEVAELVVDCIVGKRDADNGKTIYLRRNEAGERIEMVV